MAFHKPLQAFKEQLLVDAHEKRLDIYLHHPAVAGIVVAALPYHFLHSLLSVESSLAGATAVAVVYEIAFHLLLQLIDDQVVNNAVSELCRKHLPAYGVCHHEGDAPSRLIGTPIDVLPEFHQIGSQVHFKPDGTGGIPLVFPAGIVCLYHLFQRNLVR